MATNPNPDIEVLKKQPRRKRNQLPLENVSPSEYKKKPDPPFADSKEDEEEAWESPNNFFYERKYLDL